ncbi:MULTISPECIES: hypothetical protein [unclassified Nocardia]|uniref:hypothetical protein n=1 Tax=unclassified Nocardia TaxID=2637762 RepID=UPI001CE46FA5|nr:MULTISPECIES: hypothetical protein [unclassified Nocardia]
MNSETKSGQLTFDVALLQRLPESSPANDAAPVITTDGTVTQEDNPTHRTRCVR